jgi:hypothetical protein
MTHSRDTQASNQNSAVSPDATTPPVGEAPDRSCDPLDAWLARCLELAMSDLDGIEDPSQELAALAHGDRRLMERAYRYLRDAMEREPDNTTFEQMSAFWRRAFEKGSWGWDDKDGDPHRYLS